MRNNNGSVVAGVILIGLGGIFLVETWLHINLWSFFWPGLLIVLGVAILMRPRTTTAGVHTDTLLLGNQHRGGEWQVAAEDMWLGIGDLELDFTRAVIPAGETVLRYSGFIGDVRVTAPANVGVSITANGFISNIKHAGREQPSFFMPNRFETESYATAERRLRLETTFFIHDVKLR
jgi:hypothetical protein